ncbi:hypothetical protein D3C81_1929100 [compost metagenome]
MIRAEQRTVWVCEDGAEFDGEPAAQQHAEYLLLLQEIEMSSCIDWDDTSAEEVAAWLVETYTLTRK